MPSRPDAPAQIDDTVSPAPHERVLTVELLDIFILVRLDARHQRLVDEPTPGDVPRIRKHNLWEQRLAAHGLVAVGADDEVEGMRGAVGGRQRRVVVVRRVHGDDLLSRAVRGVGHAGAELTEQHPPVGEGQLPQRLPPEDAAHVRVGADRVVAVGDGQVGEVVADEVAATEGRHQRDG